VNNFFINILLIIAIGLTWGASFMFTKIAAPVVGPIDLVTSRLIIAAAFLAPIFLRKRHFQGFRNHLKPLIIFGIFNATLPFFLFAYAALALNAGTLSVMNATSPLFAFVISILWLRFAFSWIQLVGLLIGFTGLIVFVGYESLQFSWIPFICCLLGAFMYGACSNYLYKLSHIDPAYLATMTLIVGTMMFIPFSVYEGDFSFDLPRRVLISILLLGFLCTGLAYVAFVILIRRMGPVGASSVLFIVPVAGMVWANIFLNESITISMLSGCFLILLGVGMTNFFGPELKEDKL
jgi:drug/metabolite transporter (DMT)-like permease